MNPEQIEACKVLVSFAESHAEDVYNEGEAGDEATESDYKINKEHLYKSTTLVQEYIDG